MQTVTYAEFRKHPAEIMDKACNDHSPVIVTRHRGGPVVVMSHADYEALEETAYLLRSPKNASRLLDAIVSLESGALKR